MEITQTLALLINKWWGIMLPVILGIIFRKEIMEFWNYLRFRWCKEPYTNVGNIVQFEIGDTKWKIHAMDKKVILFYQLNAEGKPSGLTKKMEMANFIRCTIYFDADI